MAEKEKETDTSKKKEVTVILINNRGITDDFRDKSDKDGGKLFYIEPGENTVPETLLENKRIKHFIETGSYKIKKSSEVGK